MLTDFSLKSFFIMNGKHESKLNMYHAVVKHGDDNAAIVAAVPAFQTAFNAFKTKVSAISSTAQLEAQVISGVALDKAQLRTNLAQQATDLAAVIYAYASSVNNLVLREQVHFNLTDLLRLKDDLLGPTCSNIKDAAQANVAALAAYGITAASITAFSDAIDEYNTVVPSPRNAISLRAAYRTSIKNLFAEADNILKNQLDKLSVQFKTTQPDFLATYKNNRVIIDSAVSATQIKGKVTNADGTIPLIGVKVEVMGQSISATTNTRGNYNIKPLSPGNYQVKFSKSGLQDLISPVLEVKLGKATKADASLAA